jgi:hypothetical protein
VIVGGLLYALLEIWEERPRPSFLRTPRNNPKEHAMSTDSYAHTDEDGDEVWIHTHAPDRAIIETSNGVYIDKEDAPIIALAILRNAGWDENTSFVQGILQVVTDMQAAIDHEKAMLALIEQDIAREEAARDAHALDQEALALLNAAVGVAGRESFRSLADTQSSATREFWRAAARKAREIHSN